MEFRLDQTQLQLVEAGNTDEDPLKPSKPGMIKYTHVEPNVIPLLFLKLELPLAHWSCTAILGWMCALGEWQRHPRRLMRFQALARLRKG